ncbi:hypothetical protein [Streptomyces sp. NPDC059258]|uniref:hypothetical protein n=1 Tax=unclassified Streptomyces TaxID=2593676 RepID=UPI0036738A94
MVTMDSSIAWRVSSAMKGKPDDGRRENWRQKSMTRGALSAHGTIPLRRSGRGNQAGAHRRLRLHHGLQGRCAVPAGQYGDTRPSLPTPPQG